MWEAPRERCFLPPYTRPSFGRIPHLVARGASSWKRRAQSPARSRSLPLRRWSVQIEQQIKCKFRRQPRAALAPLPPPSTPPSKCTRDTAGIIKLQHSSNNLLRGNVKTRAHSSANSGHLNALPARTSGMGMRGSEGTPALF